MAKFTFPDDETVQTVANRYWTENRVQAVIDAYPPSRVCAELQAAYGDIDWVAQKKSVIGLLPVNVAIRIHYDFREARWYVPGDEPIWTFSLMAQYDGNYGYALCECDPDPVKGMAKVFRRAPERKLQAVRVAVALAKVSR